MCALGVFPVSAAVPLTHPLALSPPEAAADPGSAYLFENSCCVLPHL